MKKIQFKKIRFILLIPLVLFSLATITVKADAGWDSDYGGGGGYDSGSWSSSDWSSSDWSSSSSSGSYSSSSHQSSTSEIVLCVIFMMILIVVISLIVGNQMSTPTPTKKYVKEITEEELHKYLPEYSLEQLKNELYDKFLAVQNAWMDFDYDKLKEICSDELYNSYKSSLEALKIKNGQNIMHDFVKYASAIMNVKEENNTISVLMYLEVKFYDYVIDVNTKNITRGNNDYKVNNRYYLVFTKSKDTTKENKCPKCGAELKDASQTKCEYCRSEIVKTSDEFVLSKKNIV